MCNGNGSVVDFTGACCAGEQDAGGLCCPLPSTVDEFGVCGGKSNSGISVLNLRLSSNTTSGDSIIVTLVLWPCKLDIDLLERNYLIVSKACRHVSKMHSRVCSFIFVTCLLSSAGGGCFRG